MQIYVCFASPCSKQIDSCGVIMLLNMRTHSVCMYDVLNRHITDRYIPLIICQHVDVSASMCHIVLGKCNATFVCLSVLSQEIDGQLRSVLVEHKTISIYKSLPFLLVLWLHRDIMHQQPIYLICLLGKIRDLGDNCQHYVPSSSSSSQYSNYINSNQYLPCNLMM